ncbi:MAG: glycoside hydrolase family 55 protein [Epibacterium sp.]|nr:glycoside hydrolase family 55 protein [Epibacterium sp.]NQX74262.1 hypothetical protein [Epibacterium sp.]
MTQLAKLQDGMRDGSSAFYLTLNEAISADLQEGKHVIITDRDYALGKVETSGTPDTYGVIQLNNGNFLNIQVEAGVVNVKHFGAKGDGTNATQAIRAGVARIASTGGALYFPEGYYKLGTNDVPGYCIRIPDNVDVYGESKASILELEDPESGNFLLVNDRADTATGYEAASNITIRNLNLRMSDGAEITNVGDVIAIGHGQNITIKHNFFGQMAGHCVDIGGCKNVVIDGNFHENTNGLTGYAENSAFQVDSANGAAFSGINQDGTESENVQITNNHITSLNTNTLIHVGHNNGYAKNVVIANNYMKGTARNFGKFIRCDVDGASIDGLVISGNTFESVSKANTAIISLVTNANQGESLKNIVISDNTIKGFARVGVDIGATANYTGSLIPDVKNIVITGNTIDIDFDGSGTLNAGIQALILKSARIESNVISMSKPDNSVDIFGINSVTCSGVSIKSNKISLDVGTFTDARISCGIQADRFGSVATGQQVFVDVESNTIDMDNFRYGVHSKFLSSDDNLLISKTRFLGSLVGDAHIYECIPSSDGTNGYKIIPLNASGDTFINIGTGTEYPISTGLIKEARFGFIRSKEVIDICYSSGGSSGLSTDDQTLVNNNTNVALQVKNINPSAGTFTVVTGTLGITSTFTTAGSSTRTFGSISIRAGI